jgi:hypothetical protein
MPLARQATQSISRSRFSSILGWTHHSYFILSGFLLTLFLLGYIWWPLAKEYLSYIDWQGSWWLYLDWLLLGIFLVMSLLIMAGADLRVDFGIILVGIIGGLVIESWGTQTNLWHYYTAERPPLWIIPAWPIASLSIDRIVRILQKTIPRWKNRDFKITYWLVFPAFYALMLNFIQPTLDKSLSLYALGLVTLLILTPTDHRMAVLTFIAGSGLGYFLEHWGTRRECWTYYTYQTPPLFAVLAHGMAAVAFWRSVLLLNWILSKIAWKGRTSSMNAHSDHITNPQ